KRFFFFFVLNKLYICFYNLWNIAQIFGIPPNTLSTILKNKDKLLEQKGDYNFNSKRKRITTCVNNDVDQAILKWVTTAREKNLPLSGTLIREKAKEFAVALGRENFSASVGWLDKFKKRHNIAQMSICGESASADLQSSEDWKKNDLPDLIIQYHENDIVNADETSIFFKCLPNKTIAFKGQKCFGGKNSKERITVMVASNMSGSEKLKLLVIGKSKNPRCFKGIKSLDVDYEYNKKAWMTSEIYDKWLKNLDKVFVAQNRKILLFVDNCAAYAKNVQANLKNIKLQYFPPNLTSVLQPMDQGIIQNLKQHYRKRIVMKVSSI
ncbi:tigger transposable element-derived protein 4-like, partial [Bactrocera dorsalis]|uniref:Tigger transposable element-derived protein 4-like n=1 Tax=Bactrocera dorsalis TaxID=27457 RepID=A0ABM3K5V4_BACDO